MKQETVRQHTVPRVYLKHFAFARRNSLYVFSLDKKSKRLFEMNIEDASVQKHFYTLKYNKDTDAWEKYYSDIIEPLIEGIIGKLIAVASSVLIQDRTVVFNSEIKMAIAGLMLTQHNRGQNTRDYQNKLFDEFIPEAREQLYRDFRKIDRHDIDAILDKYNHDEELRKQLFAEAIQNSNVNGNIQKMIADRKWTLFRIAEGEGEFITSDAPVLLANDVTGNARPFENGLVDSCVTVYFPISPKLLIACYHNNRFTVENRLVMLNYDKEKKWIREVNRAIYNQCNRQCFAHSRKYIEEVVKTL